VRRIETAEEGTRELARLLAGSRRAVVFTGAGISTESGIPDFRSPGGIWTKYRPIDFPEFLASEEARREAWRRRFGLDQTLSRATPNRGHRAIATLVRRGLVTAIITQNIDGLHQASGVPEEKVVELHGNTTYARCLGCGQRHELADVRAEFERDERPPRCGACGGHVKTATISFGQPMPQEAMVRAAAAAFACDLFLATGSSLVVYPAASFPVLAKRNGATLAILNREPTELDEFADLVLNCDIGPTLGAAVGVE
jgi:NAD-dependent protein deacetylase/lipoamidase